jgi:translation initiation factor 6
MRVSKLEFQKNPNIGLFGFATDSKCFLGRHVSKKSEDLARDVLKTEIVRTDVLGTNLAGVFLAGNSKGVIASDRLYKEELDNLKKKTGLLILETKYTALGNLILMNDNGIIISESLKDHKEAIKKFFGLPVETGSVCGLDLVGSLALATNRGCLVHKDVSSKEANLLEKVLKVGVMPGSVNFGNPWIRSGIISNSRGLLFGNQTSGPEMGIITEALGFV